MSFFQNKNNKISAYYDLRPFSLPFLRYAYKDMSMTAMDVVHGRQTKANTKSGRKCCNAAS